MERMWPRRDEVERSATRSPKPWCLNPGDSRVRGRSEGLPRERDGHRSSSVIIRLLPAGTGHIRFSTRCCCVMVSGDRLGLAAVPPPLETLIFLHTICSGLVVPRKLDCHFVFVSFRLTLFYIFMIKVCGYYPVQFSCFPTSTDTIYTMKHVLY